MRTIRDFIYKTWKYYRLVFKPIFLEIHVAQHCNLNCVSCTHFSPIAEDKFLNITSLKQDLILLKKKGVISFFNTIRLMGGEPLLNPEIENIIKTTRGILKKKKIIVVTNGTLLESMPESFFTTCKENKIAIGVTLYPVKLDLERIEKKLNEHGISYFIYGDRTGDMAFRLTLIREKYKPELRKRNHMECFENSCYQLCDGKLFSCPQSAYKEILNSAFGTNLKHYPGDYLNIKDIKRTAFLKYHFTSKPFCSHCVFPQLPVDWKVSAKSLSEWVLRDEEKVNTEKIAEE